MTDSDKRKMPPLIYTASFGPEPLTAQPTPGVTLVTNLPPTEQWDCVVQIPVHDGLYRLNQRAWKVFGPWWLHEPGLSIYSDHELLGAHALADLDAKNIAMFSHPKRTRWSEEWDRCVEAGHVQGPQPARPARDGLWAGGVVVRRPSDPLLRAMADWWRWTLRFRCRDQLAVPFVLTPETIPGNVYGR